MSAHQSSVAPSRGTTTTSTRQMTVKRTTMRGSSEAPSVSACSMRPPSQSKQKHLRPWPGRPHARRLNLWVAPPAGVHRRNMARARRTLRMSACGSDPRVHSPCTDNPGSTHSSLPRTYTGLAGTHNVHHNTLEGPARPQGHSRREIRSIARTSAAWRGRSVHRVG